MGATGDWTAPGTWNPSIADGPTSTDDVKITNISGACTVSFDGAAATVYTINSFSYNETDDVTFQNNKTDTKTLVITHDLTKDGTGTLNFSQIANTSATTVNVNGDLRINAGTFNLGVSNNAFTAFKVDGSTMIASGATMVAGIHYGTGPSFDFGATTVNGTLVIGDATRAGKNSTIKYNGLSGSGTYSAVDGTSGAAVNTLQFTQTTGSAIFSGSLSQGASLHSIALTLSGGGRQVFTGTLSYTGVTQITGGGVLQFGNNTATQLGTGNLSMSGGTSVNGGSILGLGNSSGSFTRTVSATTGTGAMQMTGFAGFAAYGVDQSITLNGGSALAWGSDGFFTGNGTALVLGHSTADHKATFTNDIVFGGNRTVLVHRGTSAVDGALSGVLSDGTGARILTKSGDGVLELKGANSYSGGTVVSAGTLLVNNTSGSGTGTGGVSVASGAKLGGTGTISGLVTTVDTTSVIAPGAFSDTPTLRLDGGLKANAGANFQFALGTVSDALTIGGTFTGSTAAGGLVFDFSDAGGIAAGVSYTLINFGTTSSLTVSDFALSASSISAGFVLDSTFGTGGFLLDGDSLEVRFSTVVSAVPEPSTCAVLSGLAVVGFAGLRRRKCAV